MPWIRLKVVPTLREVRFFNRSRTPAECRDDAHRYTSSQRIGPGIERRICGVCSAISIDLTADDTELAQGLFTDRSLSRSRQSREPHHHGGLVASRSTRQGASAGSW